MRQSFHGQSIKRHPYACMSQTHTDPSVICFSASYDFCFCCRRCCCCHSCLNYMNKCVPSFKLFRHVFPLFRHFLYSVCALCMHMSICYCCCCFTTTNRNRTFAKHLKVSRRKIGQVEAVGEWLMFSQNEN